MTIHNGLDEAFAAARSDGQGALIPYLTAGYPEVETFVDIAVAVLEAGADALEIGVPFSDPLLDGPAIQHSQQEALQAGITPGACLHIAEQIHRRHPAPLLFMGAYNPFLTYGLDQFCRRAAQNGITGLIVPDVPLEEQGELRRAAGGNELHLIQMIAPTSTDARIEQVCAQASGFVYCISVTGVTGARTGVAATARPLVERVRRCTGVPIGVGFGISGPEQVQEVITFADAVIVGSALINLLGSVSSAERLGAVQEFIGGLKRATRTSAVS